MISPSTKTSLLKYHRWIGLALGVLILVQGLTGALMPFRDELTRLIHPSAMIVAPSATTAPLQGIIDTARGLRDGARVTRIDYPTQPDEAYLVRIEGPQGAGMLLASFDPGTGKLLRAGSLAAWPIEFAFHLHYTLLSGDTGERIIGLSGLLIIVLAIIGFLVWWPGRRSLKAAMKVKFSAGGIRATRDLHRLGGAVLAIVLILTAFTGTLIAWKPWIEPVVTALAPTREVPVPNALITTCPEPRTVDDAVTAAQGVKNGEKLKSVRFPGKGGIVAVYFVSGTMDKPRATDHVWVDRCTAQVLAKKEADTALAGDLFFDWLLPIHAGEWLGMTGRIIAVIGALALAGFGVTGYILWIARKTKTRKAVS